MATKRNYKAEYKKFHSSPKAKKDRAARNKMALIKRCPEGTEVDHIDGNPRNNNPSNCRCISVSKNRGRRQKSRLKGSKRR
jgi:hypothetical protein